MEVSTHMPIGDFVNFIPGPGLPAHPPHGLRDRRLLRLAQLQRRCRLLGWGFSLFALAEISYMTYHLDWTVFLFAHTISEVLDLVAFVLVFVGRDAGVTAPACAVRRAGHDGSPRRWSSARCSARPGAARRCAADSPAEPVATDHVDLPPSYRFEPEVITVPDGTTVTWTNHDNFTHNVRLLDDGGEVLTLAPGESVTFTFTGPGEHRYDCSFHPDRHEWRGGRQRELMALPTGAGHPSRWRARPSRIRQPLASRASSRSQVSIAPPTMPVDRAPSRISGFPCGRSM